MKKLSKTRRNRPNQKRKVAIAKRARRILGGYWGYEGYHDEFASGNRKRVNEVVDQLGELPPQLMRLMTKPGRMTAVVSKKLMNYLMDNSLLEEKPTDEDNPFYIKKPPVIKPDEPSVFALDYEKAAPAANNEQMALKPLQT